jgi:excisionase family DNA binding protein
VSLAFEVPTELVEAIASRAAEIVLERLASEQPDGGRWMSVETAAAHLDVSVERVRKLIARRELPFYQEAPGCRILLSRSELDGWMQSFRQKPDLRGGDA